jgi:hypothetical protein
MAKTKVTGEYLKDSVVRFTAKAGENITKGNAVYISGISGELPVVSLADADDTAKMPAFGLAEATVLTNAEVEVTSFGTLANLDTSSYTLGDILYVGTTAGALTNDPAGLEATKLQNIGIVQRVHASNGSIKVGGAGRTNAVPNLDNGDIFIGNSDNKAVSSALSTEIESYLDGGTSTPTFASVGIGTTTTPSDDLHVVGDIRINSNTPQLKFTSADNSSNSYSISANINDSTDGGFFIQEGLVNGTNVRLAINATGNVGIGTSSPLAIGGHTGVLTLYGSNATALVLQNSTSSSRIAQLGSDLAFFNNTYETERMRLTSTGLDAAASLKIESSTGGELILSSSDTAQAVDQFIAGLAFKTADASAPSLVPHYAGIKSVAGDVYGNQNLEFYSGRDRYEAGTNPNMVILGDTTGTDGNVGIGTSSPDEKLHVVGQASLEQAGNTNRGNLILGPHGSGTSKWSTLAGTHYNDATGSGNGSGSAGVMIIGCHAQNGSNELYVGGGPYELNPATKIRFWTHTTDTHNLGGTERMRIESNGRVYMGGTAGSYGARLTLFRDGYSLESRSTGTGSEGHIVFQNGNGAVGSIFTSGSSTSYNTSSDYRLKENVVDMEGALDRVNQLQPKRFNFIADADTTVDGFLAHEVQDIVPEAISGEKDAVDDEDNPIYQGIDQSKLVPLLVKAVQEQQEQIESLKSEIELLKGN